MLTAPRLLHGWQQNTESHYRRKEKMKKLFSVLMILIMAFGLMFIAASAEAIDPLIGWTHSGTVHVVYGPLSPSDFQHVEGAGSLSQTVNVPGDWYVFNAWCIGNSVFTVNGQVIQCPNYTSWGGVHLYLPNPYAGDVSINIDMRDGDDVDSICLYSFGSQCPPFPSFVVNPGFDAVSVAPTPTIQPSPTIQPTPTCVPRGKSGKCR